MALLEPGMRLEGRRFMEILKLGIPISGAMFMECSVFACITLFIGVLGAITVAGHQIALNYAGMVFTIPLSIGMALTVRVGHAIGAGDPAGARRISHTGSLLAVLVALVTVTFTLLCSGFVVSIYTKDPEVSRIAVGLLSFGAMYQLSDAFMVTAQGALRGYKDANMTCLLSFVAYWVITIPLGYLLSLTDYIVPAMGAKGFWISLIVGLTIAGTFLSLRLNLVSKRLIRGRSRAMGTPFISICRRVFPGIF